MGAFTGTKVTSAARDGASYQAGMGAYVGWHIISVDDKDMFSFGDILNAFKVNAKPLSTFTVGLSTHSYHACDPDTKPGDVITLTNVPPMDVSIDSANSQLANAKESADQQ